MSTEPNPINALCEHLFTHGFQSTPNSKKAPDPAPSEPVDGPQLLDDLSQFIGRYLLCSEDQRRLLALWTLHIWSFSAFSATPYLAILSSQPQAGKTLCLQLLALLSQDPSLTASLEATVLLIRMRLNPPSVILLDDAHNTIGTLRRPKNHLLRSLLVNGSGLNHSNLYPTKDESSYCPKAFSTTGQLPNDLAQHCIPIILEPLPRKERRWFNSNGIQRCDMRKALKEAEPLKQRLNAWSRQHLDHLKDLPCLDEDDFPHQMSFSPLNPRRMQLVEPLIQLANEVGGPWPNHIAKAISYIFDDGDYYQLAPNRQLLEDIHFCFYLQGFPDCLPSSFLLDWLHSQQNRSWQLDGPLTAHKLSQLLGAYEVSPRAYRFQMDEKKKKEKVLRGYRRGELEGAWLKVLGLEIVRNRMGEWESRKVPSSVPPMPTEVTGQQNEENTSKNAACSGVAEADKTPVSSGPNSPAEPAPVEQEVSTYPITDLPNYPIQESIQSSVSSTSTSPEIDNQNSEIINKNALCNSVAEESNYQVTNLPNFPMEAGPEIPNQNSEIINSKDPYSGWSREDKIREYIYLKAQMEIMKIKEQQANQKPVICKGQVCS